MSKEKQCIVCSKSIINRRCDTKTCSNSCRTRLWRLSNAGPVSLKVVLSRIEFNQLKSDADTANLLVNQLVIARAMQRPTDSIYS